MPKGHAPNVYSSAIKKRREERLAGHPLLCLPAGHIWDPEDEEYAQEMEKGKEGHFDFPFENTLNQPAEVGFFKPDCDCSVVDICLLPAVEWERYRQEILKNPLTAQAGNWEWHKVATSDINGFEVPAETKGLVRLAWHGRREAGQRLRLAVTAWNQPLANVGRRFSDRLEVPTLVAHPHHGVYTQSHQCWQPGSTRQCRCRIHSLVRHAHFPGRP